MREFPEPISVEDAVRSNEIQIEVAPEETLSIGPFEERYSEAYRIAEVHSFEDLQTLGLVPLGVSEQQASEALIADDHGFEERQRDIRGRSEYSRREINSVQGRAISRSRIQTNLTEVLPSPFRSSMTLGDPGIIHVYHHLSRWFDKPDRYLIGVVRSNNIIIREDGVLIMSPTVNMVDVDMIDLGSNARLKFQSGSVNVRCSTLNGPIESATPTGPSGSSPGHTPEGPFGPHLMSAEEIAEKYLPGYSREKPA